MKRIRPSGSQQRKLKKARERETQTMSGSILKFVMPSDSNVQIKKTVDEIPLSSREDLDKNQREVDGDENERAVAEVKAEYKEEEEAAAEVDIENQTLLEESHDLVKSTHLMEETDLEDHNSRGNGAYLTKVTTMADDEDKTNEIPDIYVDVGDWPIPVSDHLRVDLIKRGSELVQNKEGPFVKVQRLGENSKGKDRQLTTGWFFKNLPNSEKVLRSWMVYSKTKESLFCFCCRLFAKEDKSAGTSAFVTGFKTWWKLNPKVSQHECSEQHFTCMEKWKTLRARLNLKKTIDHACQENADKERKKWRDILNRLLHITLFLASQNLPFRGHREDTNSANKGNFLELVELLSNYDPVLKEHLVRIQHSFQSRTLMTSYLSPKIQNEFISVLANTVRDKILSDIKKAKYFGILFDSTPDVSHTDQMCELLRYVHIENGKVEVRESFLGFISLIGKKSDALTDEILKNLEKDGLDITLCRSQGYDNASVMSGVHKGVQARIREINPKALFVPCANHSLNLCGVHAFGSVSSCVTFFGTIERVYTFFSASTHRWDVLIETVGVSVKRLCETRWSAHHDAVKPVKINFSKLVEAVEGLSGPDENFDTRGSAQILLPAICDFSFLCYLSMWSDVLEEINHTQKYLQIASMAFEKSVIKLRELKLFLKDKRESVVENAIIYANNMCKKLDISVETRGRRRFTKMMPGEQVRDVGLTLPQQMKQNMYQCLDRFYQELDIRTQTMEEVSLKFSVVQPSSLVNASDEELRKQVTGLIETFDEISQEEMLDEIARLRRLLKAAEISNEVSKKWPSVKFLEFIVEMDFAESMPNLFLALRFYLTVCVSISSCERSFSKLKLIKNYLRSTMGQSRLSNLAILSIEQQVAKTINFDDVITKFAETKVRKAKF